MKEEKADLFFDASDLAAYRKAMDIEEMSLKFYQDKAGYQADLDTLTARGQLTLVDRYVPNEEVPTYFAAADLVAVPYLSASQSGIVQLA